MLIAIYFILQSIL